MDTVHSSADKQINHLDIYKKQQMSMEGYQETGR